MYRVTSKLRPRQAHKLHSWDPSPLWLHTDNVAIASFWWGNRYIAMCLQHMGPPLSYMPCSSASKAELLSLTSQLCLNLAFKKLLICYIQFFLLLVLLSLINVHTVYIYVCIHHYHSTYPQDNIRDFISLYSQLNINVYHINWLQRCIDCAVLDAIHQLDSYNIHSTLTIAKIHSQLFTSEVLFLIK